MRTFLSLNLGILLIFMSCNTTKTAGITQEEITGSYTVQMLNGNVIKTVVPKFSFDGNEQAINGNTGCNSFFGKFEIKNNSISFEEMGVSEMYCSEEGVMALEREFLDALHQVKTIELKDNILTFYSESGRKILEASQGITR